MMQRESFSAQTAQWLMEHVRFLDETGAWLGMTRRYAWAEAEQRVAEGVPTHYGASYPWTLVATIGLHGLQAPWLLKGALDGVAFVAYVTEALAPTLQAGDIVVLDNAAAHKMKAAREAVEARGARWAFLPPYSPDLNPIELCWSKVKGLLRRAKARTADELLDAVQQALLAVSQTDIVHWMQHCGYHVNALL
jgi:transposase